jgi:hypothetical protein
MPAGQAQDILRQLQQQMQSPGWGQQFMGQLQGAGLGAQNPQQFFGTPFDEQLLRQSVMGRVLGYYGMPNAQSGQYGGVGSPGSILGGRFPTDPFSGGLQQQPDWSRGGFADKAAWKQAGRPTGLLGGPTSEGGGEAGNPMELMPYSGGQQIRQGGGPSQQGGFDMMGSPNQFYDMMSGYNPQVGALNNDYPGMFNDALNRAMSNYGGVGGNSGGGRFMPFMSNPNPSLPPIDQGTQSNLDQMYNAQLGNMNLDFQNQQKNMVNQLYGRGVNASTIAADTAGRLGYGREQAMNQLFAQKAGQQLDIQKALLDAQTQRIKAGGGGMAGGMFSGGGGFGGDMGGGETIGGGLPQIMAQELSGMTRPTMGNVTGNYGAGGISSTPSEGQMQAWGRGPQTGNIPGMNIMQGFMGGAGNSPIPLNFNQQMQLADMQLRQQQLQQQGQLGFGGLGLQQQLGLGSQGLQGQGLAQDFMSQLLGMGLNRQQGAAGMSQADMARMQQYLMGQNQLYAGIGQQNAQIEAQKRSFLSQLLGGLAGGASAFGSILGSGGISSLFGH